MNKDNKEMTLVYVIEKDMAENVPCVSMGIRTIPKGEFLKSAYKIIDCHLVDVR